jgi:hypothetical protein
MIMPRPFATFHSTFLRRYLDSARSTVLHRVLTLFVLHKNGFIFEVCCDLFFDVCMTTRRPVRVFLPIRRRHGDIELGGTADGAGEGADSGKAAQMSSLPRVDAEVAVAALEAAEQPPSALPATVEPLKAGSDEVSLTSSQQENATQNAAIDKQRKSAKRHRQRDHFKCDLALLRRHLTMMKISGFLGLAVLYFTVSYWVDFGSLEENLRATPFKVRETVFITQDSSSSCIYHALIMCVFIRAGRCRPVAPLFSRVGLVRSSAFADAEHDDRRVRFGPV